MASTVESSVELPAEPSPALPPTTLSPTPPESIIPHPARLYNASSPHLPRPHPPSPLRPVSHPPSRSATASPGAPPPAMLHPDGRVSPRRPGARSPRGHGSRDPSPRARATPPPSEAYSFRSDMPTAEMFYLPPAMDDLERGLRGGSFDGSAGGSTVNVKGGLNGDSTTVLKDAMGGRPSQMRRADTMGSDIEDWGRDDEKLPWFRKPAMIGVFIFLIIVIIAVSVVAGVLS